MPVLSNRPLMSADDPALPRFPSTRYLGSKARLAEWIWRQVEGSDFHTCLDAFGGTGAMAYRFKQAGKCVTYNDALAFNALIGRALIENPQTRLDHDLISSLLAEGPEQPADSFIQDHFGDIYYTDQENAWLDRTWGRIRDLADPYQQALAFFALCQAAIVKRPFNLFHRKNLYLRTARVSRSFGNKASWDRPFPEWFRIYATEANRAVFDNGQPNRALNLDALAVPGSFDLVYIDPPYISARGIAVDYRAYYHFLEGLAVGDAWAGQIDWRSKHRRLQSQPSEWTDRRRIAGAFDRLFERYQDSILVLSYRSDGIPSLPDLIALLRRHKREVRVAEAGRYQYVLSTNRDSSECLLIGA